MTEPDKPGSDESRRMGAGVLLVIVSLLLSMASLVMFMVWLGSPSYFGETLLIISALTGVAGLAVAFGSLFTRVHEAVKIIIMLVASIVALLYVFVQILREIAAGLG